MTMEWLLIPVFLLGALIMGLFVKLVDHFIENVLIPDNPARADEKHAVRFTQNSQKNRSKTGTRKTAGGIIGTIDGRKTGTCDDRKTGTCDDRKTGTADALKTGSSDGRKTGIASAASAGSNASAAARSAGMAGAQGTTIAAMSSETEKNEEINTLSFSGLLDKFRQRSNVGRDKNADNIEIGTARPMQIRIKHYEQP